jgi:hypothetical protein
MIPSLRASVVRIVESAFPALIYSVPRTYIVQAVRADKRLDLVPPPDAPYLPELPATEQWGLGVVTPVVGQHVAVWFRDADKSRPIVIGFASNMAPTAPSGFGEVPDKVIVDAATEIRLGDYAAATRGVARLNDTVASGTWSFVFAAGVLTVTYTPLVGTPTVFTVAVAAGALVVATVSGNPASIPMAGKITSASTKVKAE